MVTLAPCNLSNLGMQAWDRAEFATTPSSQRPVACARTRHSFLNNNKIPLSLCKVSWKQCSTAISKILSASSAVEKAMKHTHFAALSPGLSLLTSTAQRAYGALWQPQQSGTAGDDAAAVYHGPPTSGSHPAAVYHGPPTSGSHPAAVYCGPPTSGSHPAAVYHGPPTSSSHPAAVYCGPPTSGSHPAAVYHGPPTSSSHPAAVYCGPPTSSSHPAAVYHGPPTSSSHPAAVYYGPPTSSSHPAGSTMVHQ